jgi:hypothetical protein
MKKILLTMLAVLTTGIIAHAGDLYNVKNGSYAFTNLQSMSMLLHTPRSTNRYRAIRDNFISQGILVPVNQWLPVEVTAYDGYGIVTIFGQYGQYYYILQEDLSLYLGSR